MSKEPPKCAELWARYEKEALKVIQPFDKSHRDRNRAITQAYARLYLRNRGFVWAGLAAYASKEVGCSMDAATSTFDVTPLAFGPLGVGKEFAEAGAGAIMYNALGKGNRELFLDIYPMHLFYSEKGAAKLRACALARQPPVSDEAIAGFEEIDLWKQTGDRSHLANSLTRLAKHEQLNILQKVVYDDSVVKDLLWGNDKTPGWFADVREPSVTFSPDCSGRGRTIPFHTAARQDGRLYHPSERMDWILKEIAPAYLESVGDLMNLEASNGSPAGSKLYQDLSSILGQSVESAAPTTTSVIVDPPTSPTIDIEIVSPEVPLPAK